MSVARNNIGNIGTQVLAQVKAGTLTLDRVAAGGHPEWSSKAEVQRITLGHFNACVEAAGGEIEAATYAGADPGAAVLAGYV